VNFSHIPKFRILGCDIISMGCDVPFDSKAPLVTS
jgi:hypothetical protein